LKTQPHIPASFNQELLFTLKAIILWLYNNRITRNHPKQEQRTLFVDIAMKDARKIEKERN